MSSTSYLSGKVVKNSLPAFHDSTTAEAPTQKRLLLPHGELAQFYDSDEAMHYMAYIELRTGNVRGNHYHKEKIEFVYLIQGEATLAVEDVHLRERVSMPLRAGDLVRIETEVAHAFRTSTSGHAVEFSKTRFDPADIQRYSLIPVS